MVEKDVKYLNRSFYSAWWATRGSTIALLAVSFIAVSQTVLLLWLLPLKEIKPYFVSAYNKDSQVVKVEPFEVNKSSLKKLIEIKCREFVTDLHTFDGQTEDIRFKRLSMMVSDEIVELVESFLNTNNQNSTAKKLREEKITRSVKIQHVTHLSPEDSNKWRVEWELLEVGDQIQKRTNYVSVITAEAQAKTLSAEEADINPIGFNVTAYSVRMVE